MQRDCCMKKADEVKGKGKPGGGGSEGGHGGGPHAGAALACSASTGETGSSKAHGRTLCASTWVLESGATNHMTARDKGFTVRTAGSRAEVNWPTATRCPLRGTATSPWTLAKEAPRRASCSTRPCWFQTQPETCCRLERSTALEVRWCSSTTPVTSSATGMLFAGAGFSTRLRWSAR